MMKTPLNLQKVMDNPNEFNLTEEYLNDFLVKTREHLRAGLQNKTFTNVSNIMPEDQPTHPVVNCSEYCDSHMRQIFEEYKDYHGYVALVVSAFADVTSVFPC